MAAYTEYAVEVNNNNGFVKRIGEFNTYDEALAFSNSYDKPLNTDEFLNIIFIDYNANGDEIEFGSVV